VLVQRLHRRDGLDGEPLLDRGLAGDPVDHDGYLHDAAQRALDEHRGDADQAQHQAGDGNPPGSALRAFEHQRAVDFPRAIDFDRRRLGLGLRSIARTIRQCSGYSWRQDCTHGDLRGTAPVSRRSDSGNWRQGR